MLSATLTVSKTEVYDEVDKTTSYTGVKIDQATVPKQQDDKEAVTAYKRIRASEYDREMLERFFSEAANVATDRMKDFITAINVTNGYEATLSLSGRWDSALQPSMQKSLFSYFVSFICSRWFRMSNKAEAEGYMNDATAMLEDVMRKAYFRKKPTRVEPTT
jgi:hypothetical protein